MIKQILVDANHCLINFDSWTREEKLFEFLDGLNAEKIIVTNANEEKVGKIKGLLPVSWEVYSLNDNPNKYDSEYFRRLKEDKQLIWENVVYLDHDPKNLESATGAGMENLVLYENLEKTILEFKKYNF